MVIKWHNADYSKFVGAIDATVAALTFQWLWPKWIAPLSHAFGERGRGRGKAFWPRSKSALAPDASPQRHGRGELLPVSQ